MGSSHNPPAATGNRFVDVGSEYWAASWIEQLARDGVTTGCTSNHYCPSEKESRAQMAVFPVRTFSPVEAAKMAPVFEEIEQVPAGQTHVLFLSSIVR